CNSSALAAEMPLINANAAVPVLSATMVLIFRVVLIAPPISNCRMPITKAPSPHDRMILLYDIVIQQH
ncbi:MAG TPA: hypothetical protein VN900_09005, partial [Stellaceae bacterium]|nr:hypothetical protein [Stellaceae bacterium]